MLFKVWIILTGFYTLVRSIASVDFAARTLPDTQISSSFGKGAPPPFQPSHSPRPLQPSRCPTTVPSRGASLWLG